MDDTDIQLLNLIQQDSRQTLSQLAQAVGLSVGGCCKRLQKLRKSGVIAGEVALLDPAAINAASSIFVTLRLASPSSALQTDFQDRLLRVPGAVELYRSARGDLYLLRMMLPDANSFRSTRRLLSEMAPPDATISWLDMECLYRTTSLPLVFANRA